MLLWILRSRAREIKISKLTSKAIRLKAGEKFYFTGWNAARLVQIYLTMDLRWKFLIICFQKSREVLHNETSTCTLVKNADGISIDGVRVPVENKILTSIRLSNGLLLKFMMSWNFNSLDFCYIVTDVIWENL